MYIIFLHFDIYLYHYYTLYIYLVIIGHKIAIEIVTII